ncbi:hypothetical protein N7451_000224 [Penicillium sp. IBT 35674x]|nr:hypothetical protein N7451_000224 [Penicillium sp. IBT 35674x]
MEALVRQDPGLPRSNPTASYWQHEPHPLSAIQSAVLPATTNIAVIGSGVTGASVCKALLEMDQNHHVTVFEARTLCSGATGRNGGQMAINAAETYEQMKLDVGAEMAGKIIRFNIKTLNRLREIAQEFAAEYAECTDVTKLRAFKDMPSFEKAKAGIKALELDHPSLKGIYSVLTAEECEKHGAFGLVGGIRHASGTVWPYRLIMKIFEVLRERHESRLSLEANTPVTSVRYEPNADPKYPYVISTARGEVRSTHVAYCTNAYTGHLLPSLRGGLFPMKGTMSVQDVNHALTNKGASDSWAIHYKPFLDPADDSLADGLIYGMQNVKTGAFFFGGEKSPVSDLLSSDDTFLSASSVKFLQESLLSLFGRDPENITESKLVSAWSGIMCFSSDAMPLVGRLSETITHNSGEGEWISAAYSGYGMATAWLSGESLAAMILGQSAQDCLPEAYLVSESRLQSSISAAKSIERLYL